MYAVQPQPISSPVVIRLIGVLDADLVAAFGTLERGLVGAAGRTVVVDVRDLHALGETEVHALVETVASARRDGRDVRLEARGLHWRRAIKQKLSAQPPAGAALRSAARRTVILAHSARKRR